MNSFDDEEIEMTEKPNNIKIKMVELFHLLNNGIINTIEIIELENDIIKIKCNKYELDLYLIQFNKIFKKEYKSIKDCFDYLSNLFENDKIYIKKIVNGEYFELSVSSILSEEININLEYKDNSSISIYIDIFKEYYKQKLDVEKLNKILNKINIKYDKDEFNDPKNINFSSDIIRNSFANYSYENSFTVYESQNKNLQIVYATKDKSIISQCINTNKANGKNKGSYYDDKIGKGFTQNKAHKNFITNIKYYFDEINNLEIIMTTSKKDNIIKLWKVNNGCELYNEIKANNSNFLFSACFFKQNNESYIITSNGKTLQQNQEIENFESLKLFKLNKKEPFKQISDSEDCTYFVDIYHDKILNKNFIITGNFNYIKSYDYEKDELYHKYYENNNGIHPSVIVNAFGEIIKLIESCEDGNIRIWEFHSSNLVKKINTENNNLYGICLWNENYIFVGCKDKSIKLIELKNGILIKSLEGHQGRIISFKKCQTDKTENLYSQGLDGTIKLWTNPKSI